ncbi:hypothetical protein X975_25210, partial [Stegodyphus mimosarum]
RKLFITPSIGYIFKLICFLKHNVKTLILNCLLKAEVTPSSHNLKKITDYSLLNPHVLFKKKKIDFSPVSVS